MLRAIGLCCVLLWTGSASAASDGRCEATAELAFFIMSARQEGVPKDELMTTLTAGEPEAGLAGKLISEAYETPIHPAGEAKEQAATDFQGQVSQRCAM